MEDNNLINKFGYAEMYEWSRVPDGIPALGRVVQFDPESPGKIRPAVDYANIIGVSAINAVAESDNPDHWHAENLCNEYGDAYMKKSELVIGEKKYDNLEEMAYIATRPWSHYVPIKNRAFDKGLKYVPRVNRPEWVRVCIMGKTVVEDDGTCMAGGYGCLYEGRLMERMGTLTACDDAYCSYYIIERLSEKTVKVFVRQF